MKYKVAANPKGGTCFQFVEADTETEAIAKAKENPNGWQSPTPRSLDAWSFRAYPRGES